MTVDLPLSPVRRSCRYAPVLVPLQGRLPFDYEGLFDLQETTYSVRAYFNRREDQALNSIIITANGQDVHVDDRAVFAPGAGDQAQFVSKSFEIRTGGLLWRIACGCK